MISRPSGRGAGLLAAIAVAAVHGALAADPVSLSSAILISLAMAVDAAVLGLGGRKACEARPPAFEARMWAWEERVLRLEILCPRAEGLEGLPGWLAVERISKVRGGIAAILRASSKSPGLYSVEGLVVVGRSPLGLFTRRAPVRVRIAARVLPEALYWVREALKLLAGGPGAFAGDSRGPGRGAAEGSLVLAAWAAERAGEYYVSREYVPGDDLRRIDWKATARTMKLHVKEFRGSGGSGISLLLDFRCIGRHTCDSVASSALSLAIFSWRDGVQIYEIVEIASGLTIRGPRREEALAWILSRILSPEVARVLEMDAYEVADPPTLREVERILARLGSSRALRWRGHLGDAARAIIVTSIVHDAASALDAVERINLGGGRAAVLTPPRPWADARDLREAYSLYMTYVRAVEKLRRMGAEVFARDRGPSSGGAAARSGPGGRPAAGAEPAPKRSASRHRAGPRPPAAFPRLSGAPGASGPRPPYAFRGLR